MAVLLALASLLAAPAINAAARCDDLNNQPINPKVRWPQVWQALNQQASCTQNCHNGSDPVAELDFSSAQLSIYFLVNQPSLQSPDLLRVRPGDPQRSLLLQKVNCRQPDVGQPMPPPNGHVPIALQGLIYDWIAQGAYGESREDPIARDFVFRDAFESMRCRSSADGSNSRCRRNDELPGGSHR